MAALAIADAYPSSSASVAAQLITLQGGAIAMGVVWGAIALGGWLRQR